MDLNSNFRVRLREAIDYSGLQQVEVAKLSGISKSLLNKYLKGISEAGNDKLLVLGKALNVSPVWLMGYDVPMRENINDSDESENILNVFAIESMSIPCLGEIACGKPIYANENKELYVAAGIKVKADFCLIAKGDSMIGARIHDGDIVFIRRQEMVNNGEIAAVVINDEATLKRVFYYPDKGKLVLQAENPTYEPLVYVGEELNEIRILGKAVAFQSDVK